MTADEVASALLTLSRREPVCILDSCGVGDRGRRRLLAGIEPRDIQEKTSSDPAEILAFLDDAFAGDTAAIFTVSYDFGLKLLGIESKKRIPGGTRSEPDVFLARFDTLIMHDYDGARTYLVGDPARSEKIRRKLLSGISDLRSEISDSAPTITSNFSRPAYRETVENIKELIRCGDTYQTNLTQRLSASMPPGLSPERIFDRIRREHPAPYAAFITRLNSTVVSASPERFFTIAGDRITTSPIKGTRKRGVTIKEDEALREELNLSLKDRAENTMIVDLLRNDIGKVCEYGSVKVEKLCELEAHPTFFHLVSTVSGDLRDDIKMSDILTALFPCGSITGAPKISTMRIIEQIETVNRGLSMGAIGYTMPDDRFGISQTTDLSVAIRTMTIEKDRAAFNVGGGIVIDSDPDAEYEETLTKATALIEAMGGNLPQSLGV